MYIILYVVDGYEDTTFPNTEILDGIKVIEE
jgi:hypothetical protein